MLDSKKNMKVEFFTTCILYGSSFGQEVQN